MRQILDELFLLGMFRLLLNLGGLHYIVGYFFESIRRNSCSFRQWVQHLQFFVFLKFILTNDIDKITNIVNIVCEKQASAEGYDNDEECFNIIPRVHVAKANGKNDSCSEIVAPDIFLIPVWCVNTTHIHPAILRMNMGYCY